MTAGEEPDKPIPGPATAGPGDGYVFAPDWSEELPPLRRLIRRINAVFHAPSEWIRKNIVEPNRGEKYYYYHRRYPRVLPVDECYIDDLACQYEANIEFERTRMVDRATLNLLRDRMDGCWFWHDGTKSGKAYERCEHLKAIYDREEINYFLKYGELRWDATVVQAFNRQKHLMIMDRRRAAKGEMPEETPEFRAA